MNTEEYATEYGEKMAQVAAGNKSMQEVLDWMDEMGIADRVIEATKS